MTKKENSKMILKIMLEISGIILFNVLSFILIIFLALINTFFAIISILFLATVILSMMASFFIINDKILKIKELLVCRKIIIMREKQEKNDHLTF